MFGLGKGRKRRGCRQRCQCAEETQCSHLPDNTRTLNSVPDGERVVVTANPDVKTMEMGLHPGGLATVVHNDHSEHNIIVRVFDQRLIVPRKIAKTILVGECKRTAK